MTSSVIAESVNTHPVVIRRLLSILSRAGIVCTGKGANSGSRLQRPPSEITLDEIFRVTTPASSIALHPHAPDQRCKVGHNIEGILIKILGAARMAFDGALASYTLADVLRQVAESASGTSQTSSSSCGKAIG